MNNWNQYGPRLSLGVCPVPDPGPAQLLMWKSGPIALVVIHRPSTFMTPTHTLRLPAVVCGPGLLSIGTTWYSRLRITRTHRDREKCSSYAKIRIRRCSDNCVNIGLIEQIVSIGESVFLFEACDSSKYTEPKEFTEVGKINLTYIKNNFSFSQAFMLYFWEYI